MEIHYEELSDVQRYIGNNKDTPLTDKERDFDILLRYIEQFRPIDSSLNMLEIGTGMGWVPIIAKKRGLKLRGIEISPALIAAGREYGKLNGVEPDLVLGNIETFDIGENLYDVIIANSVFEHVEQWRVGLERIYRALKPGGYTFFESTNKWSPISAEHRLPCYGWMPDWMRYRFRMAVQGADIMKNGIDFHQFTYPLLRRTFKQLGYREIYDRVALVQPNLVQSPLRRSVAEACKRNVILKHAVLTFFETTTFVCRK